MTLKDQLRRFTDELKNDIDSLIARVDGQPRYPQPYPPYPYQQPPYRQHYPQLQVQGPVQGLVQGPAQGQQAPLAHAPHPMAGPSQPVWQTFFQPTQPVSVDWDLKTGHGENGWGNQELQCYTDRPDNAFYTAHGQLVVRALANNHLPDDQRFTSARLVSRRTLGRDRGILTGIVRSPCAAGIWPAFWLLPQEPFSWPTDGEIDIAETWNGDLENHSCLHWGQHHEPDKHRVLATRIPDMAQRPVRYDFVWDQADPAVDGRLLWYIDGRPVLKAAVPAGTRPLRDFTVLLNVAMGGNVCAGKTPADGYYDLVIDGLYLADVPDNGGWDRFNQDWNNSGTSLGHTY